MLDSFLGGAKAGFGYEKVWASFGIGVRLLIVLAKLETIAEIGCSRWFRVVGLLGYLIGEGP